MTDPRCVACGGASSEADPIITTPGGNKIHESCLSQLKWDIDDLVLRAREVTARDENKSGSM